MKVDVSFSRRSDGIVAGRDGRATRSDPPEAGHRHVPALRQRQAWTVVTISLQQRHTLRRTPAVAGKGLIAGF